jgi:hypothetical protein
MIKLQKVLVIELSKLSPKYRNIFKTYCFNTSRKDLMIELYPDFNLSKMNLSTEDFRQYLIDAWGLRGSKDEKDDVREMLKKTSNIDLAIYDLYEELPELLDLEDGIKVYISG